MSGTDNGGLIGALRRATLFIRVTAVTVIVALGSLMAMPTVMAAKAEHRRQQVEASLEPSKQQALARQLTAAKRTLERLRDVHQPGAEQAASTARAAVGELERLRAELRESHRAMLSYYEQIRERIGRADLPPKILQRHEKAVAQYTKRMERVLDKLGKAADRRAGTRGQLQAATAALEQLERHGEGRRQQPFDPNDLPSKAVEPERKRAPRTTPAEFRDDGLSSRPWPRFAGHGEFRLDELAGADDPRWRAATTEVELNDAIEAKAAELDHDPVAIHAWVRNNVQWIPTWGAMQDATHTLSSRRGNAFDIAGLEIALLRASGIPARYAVGTIEVDADRFRNWAGGFEDVRAAADYAASGGIATASLVEAGRISAVRMEHVWVEAAVDYLPSRGAVNKSADTWIALDPSFKQYDYAEGIDVAAVTGIDAEQTAQSFLDSGTIDEQAGWVQGFDPTILQNTQADAEAALEDYIANDLPDDATVRDVLGGRRIVEQAYETLPASIPNQLVTTGVRYDELPEKLQHRIAFGLGTTITGGLSNPVEFAWAAVNGEQVTLSFRPATQADADALKSLLPDGEITDPSQLPESIPSHLVDVIPELKVDGEVVSSGRAMPLGEEVDFGFTVTQRGVGSDTAVSPVAAGSYLAIAVAGGTVSPASMRRVQGRAEDTTAILESGDSQQLASLDRASLLGDLFHAGTLAYFQQLDLFSAQQMRQAGARANLAPSAGTYGYTPQVTTLFGTPQSIETGGITMDLDRVARILGGAGDDPKRVRLNTQIGALSSALEHRVPEQQFSTEGNAVEAVSATKALAVANRKGQRTYTITPGNVSTTLPSLNLSSEVISEIRSAVNAGKVVTTHTDPISVAGYNGAGYVILDPDTGSGAWKIAGGQNGGSLLDALTEFLGPINNFLSTLFTGLEGFLKRAGELVKNDVLPSVKSLAKRNSYLAVLLSMAQALTEGGGLLEVSVSILKALAFGALQGLIAAGIAAAIAFAGLASSALVIGAVAAIASFLLVEFVIKPLVNSIVRLRTWHKSYA